MLRMAGAWRRGGCSFNRFPLGTMQGFVVIVLEVLAFPSATNDVVNTVETMEREIMEFERYAIIEIPQSLKTSIVIRQAEEGSMRMHLIMNSTQVGDFSGHQHRGDERQAGPECGEVHTRATRWTWMRSRRGDPKVISKLLARARIRKSGAGIARRRAIELPIAA